MVRSRLEYLTLFLIVIASSVKVHYFALCCCTLQFSTDPTPDRYISTLNRIKRSSVTRKTILRILHHWRDRKYFVLQASRKNKDRVSKLARNLLSCYPLIKQKVIIRYSANLALESVRSLKLMARYGCRNCIQSLIELIKAAADQFIVMKSWIFVQRRIEKHCHVTLDACTCQYSISHPLNKPMDAQRLRGWSTFSESILQNSRLSLWNDAMIVTIRKWVWETCWEVRISRRGAYHLGEGSMVRMEA